MKCLTTCRRTFIALFSILCLTYLGHRGANVSEAIAAISIGLAASNAYQRKNNEKLP